MAAPATTATILDRWADVAASTAMPHIQYHGHTVGLRTTNSNRASPVRRTGSRPRTWRTIHTMVRTATTLASVWTTLMTVCFATGTPTAWRIPHRKEANETIGVIRTFNSVGTLSAVGPSQVHPKPAPTVTATTTRAVMRADSAITRTRRAPSTRVHSSATMNTMAAAAGSLMVAASAHTAIPHRSRPPVPMVMPATINPTIRASLCPEETKLNRASGLSAPNHSASPGWWPSRRASTGSETINRITPTSSMSRKTRIWATSDPPPTATARWLRETKNGP